MCAGFSSLLSFHKPNEALPGTSAVHMAMDGTSSLRSNLGALLHNVIEEIPAALLGYVAVQIVQ